MEQTCQAVRTECVGVAQLDRAFGYGPKGRGFESSRPRCNKIAGSLEKGIPAFFCPLTGEGKQRKINTTDGIAFEQKTEEMTWIDMNS